jgi:hypothetical protein
MKFGIFTGLIRYFQLYLEFELGAEKGHQPEMAGRSLSRARKHILGKSLIWVLGWAALDWSRTRVGPGHEWRLKRRHSVSVVRCSGAMVLGWVAAGKTVAQPRGGEEHENLTGAREKMW